MKTAISIPGRFPIKIKQFSDLIEGLPSTGLWDFGNVDTAEIPQGDINWVKSALEMALLDLNQLGSSQYVVRSYKSTSGVFPETPVLLYGRCTVGLHEDRIKGLQILTFLGSFCPNDDTPEHLHKNGEFFQGKILPMRQGESILFDDNEPHAWLSNAYWVFASLPVRKKRK